jgi:virginiamycin B lyase
MLRPALVSALAAALVSGVLAAGFAAAQVTVQEYPLPSRVGAHDVWADPSPDGPVWFSAQRSGHLGRLDPKTGKVDLIPLGSGSSPHGVIAGADGAPWLTDSGQNAIVRVDPKTSAVMKWPLPEGSAYANLNTAIFDREGIHWFTGQSGNYGRLDPRTGAMKVFDAPKGRGPYGIHVTPDGVVYYASLAGSHIARIDAKSAAATVIEPPTPRQGARRVWSDSKGSIWVSVRNSGQVSGMAEDRAVGAVEGPRREPARLRGVRRRDRPGLGVGVDGAGDAAVRPGDAEVRDLQVLDRARERAPDPRPQGRGLDARVGGRQARGVPLPVIR